ncbi:hypothetical protein MCOR25_007563 [Pyricularia grisea]|nr:hypothetical protein MCOR25_007563 [Pyricularia grisea]
MPSTLATLLLTILPLLATSNPLPSRPTGRDPQPRIVNDSTAVGCLASSWSPPKWTVSDFVYRGSWTYSTPSHQNAWGSVDFNLATEALAPSVSKCSATSSRLTDFFYGDQTYRCDLPTGAMAGGGTGGEATFEFNRAANWLRVNQTWTCHDAEDGWPVTFSAFGFINLTLDCTQDFYQNPNWTSGSGQPYSDRKVECKSANIVHTPDEMTAIA